MKPAFRVTLDNTSKLQDVINRFKNDRVLVGIPETDTSRSGFDNVNNATLLAINNFGSPINNIPPRPVMQNGITRSKNEIAAQFAKAAVDGLEKGPDAAALDYERAGIIASNAIKKAINNQDFDDGPSASTLAARRAAGFKGTKSLIVTGQMRNAITYVVERG